MTFYKEMDRPYTGQIYICVGHMHCNQKINKFKKISVTKLKGEVDEKQIKLN